MILYLYYISKNCYCIVKKIIHLGRLHARQWDNLLFHFLPDESL